MTDAAEQEKKTISVAVGSADWLPATIELYKSAFAEDPAVIYMINTIKDQTKLQLNLGRLITILVSAGAINNGIFYYCQQQNEGEGGDGKTAPRGSRGVLMKNPNSLDSTSTFIKTALTKDALKLAHATGLFPLVRKLLGAFQKETHACRKMALKKGEPFYYMYWLGTAAEERGKGLASGVIREMQKLARKDNVPLWTEGSTPRSARLYASMGFESIKIFRMGKGECNEKGFPEKDGPGVPINAMVWREGSKGWAEMGS